MKGIGTKLILLILAVMIILGAVYFLLENKAKINEKAHQQQGHEDPIFSRINYTVQNIDNLSPQASVLGGSWQVDNFWFADQDNFYVDYEDGHILRRILVNYNEGSYRVVGYFEPGEKDFELVEGEDTIFGRDLTLFKYNQNTQRWVKNNSSMGSE